MNWRLAKSLVKLREQIDEAHPDRDRASDGSIGDQAHAARKSEHNPDHNGVVRAIDITHDPKHGVDGHVLSRQLIKDSRTYYVIFAAQIYRTYKPSIGWVAYHGPNAHFHHVHISVVGDGHEYDDAAEWSLDGESIPERRTLKRGDSGPDVVELQANLGIKADGHFGNQTELAVREFQAHNGLTVDGIAGPETLAAILK